MSLSIAEQNKPSPKNDEDSAHAQAGFASKKLSKKKKKSKPGV
jgi:hypothetical protein